SDGIYELQAARAGNSVGGTAATRESLQRAAVRWQSGRTAAVVWLQRTDSQGIPLESASLLEAAAGKSAAIETAARPGAPARLALVTAGVSDPGGCATDPGEFPGRFSQPRLRLSELPDLRLLRADCRAGRFDPARVPHRGVEKVHGNGRCHGNRKALGCLTRAPRQRSSWTGRTVIRRWPPPATGSWRRSIVISAASGQSGEITID